MNEEIDGIYDDDGNKINVATIPKPALCLSCKNDFAPIAAEELDDLIHEEAILCLLTRSE